MPAYSLPFWQTILPLLSPWSALSVAQRAAALELTGGFQDLPPVLAAVPAKTRGMFFEKDSKSRYKPLPEFRKLIDFVERIAKWSRPDQLDTALYVQQVSTYTQRHALTGIPSGPVPDIVSGALERRMLDGWFARQWLAKESHDAFLVAVANWMPEEVPLTRERFDALKRWLRAALDKGMAGFVLDGESFLVPGAGIPAPEILYLALAYGLVQIARHPETLDVVIRIFTPVDKPAQDPEKMPMRAMVTAHTFYRPFLIDDVEAFLRSVKADPAPLLSDGIHVPMAHLRKTAKGFLPLPEPLPRMGFAPEDRAKAAWWFISALGLVAMTGRGRKTWKAALDPKGEAWLGLSRERKLQTLLDEAPCGTRRPRKIGDRFAWLGDYDTIPLPYSAMTPRIFDWLDALASRLREPVAFWDWLAAAARQANPLLADLETSAYLPGAWARWSRTPEEAFSELLCHYLGRLSSLGAVALGRDSLGNLGVSLTPIGRYQFGQADAWTLPEGARRIAVVGADFSIVLLEPDPELALELSAFADPAGNVDEGRPVLHFRLSRRSVQSGVHAGLDAEAMLRVLNAWSRTPIPANIVHEIEAWCGSKPTVRIAESILVEGRDPLVIAEILSRFPREFERLTPTVLKYLGSGKRAALLKRLAIKGFYTE